MSKAKKRNKQYAKRITRNILKGTLDATAWSFSTLFLMGEMTIEAFLNPSYSGEIPSGYNKYPVELKKIKKVRKKLKQTVINQSVRRLQKYGFVDKKEGKVFLTKKGEIIAKRILRYEKKLKKKWDGKYRIVIFDIPERNRNDRNWLREELYILKYEQLQKSVYFSRHSLTEDIIRGIKRKKIGNYVDYLLVDKIYSKF